MQTRNRSPHVLAKQLKDGQRGISMSLDEAAAVAGLFVDKGHIVVGITPLTVDGFRK